MSCGERAWQPQEVLLTPVDEYEGERLAPVVVT